VKGIQVYSNKGPSPFQRGDNYKNVKIGWGLLKIFLRTTGPILTRLDTNHPWGKWIQVCSNKGDCPSPRGGNSKREKCTENFKKNLLQHQQAKINQTWYKLSLGERNSSLLS
jgi:hypothetical protein